MPAMPKIRILIADDHAILRSGLKMLINAQPDMEVVSEAADGGGAIQAVRDARPDVALLDLTMPRSGGMGALEEIARCCPDTRVLILSMHDDPAYLRSGLAAIRAVHRGGMFIDPSLAHVFVQDALAKAATGGRAPRSLNILSERERQVLGLVAQGYGSQEIAKQILVSVKTIETYRARIAEKLGLRTRSDIVRFAVQMGLLTCDALASVMPRDSS